MNLLFSHMADFLHFFISQVDLRHFELSHTHHTKFRPMLRGLKPISLILLSFSIYNIDIRL